jgi:alpha-mannosidase
VAKEVLVVPHNHFDPTWRRAFDRTAEYNGVRVRSYAEVEERVIRRWFELAPRGYTFCEGQTAIWRKFRERNPDAEGRLREELGAGRLVVMLAGETVQDTNMPTAEGLVRNFLVATPFYREFVGEDHPGLRLAWLEDAFGNSPNYPQVLTGVGAEVACSTSYRPCPEDVWVGLDGTKILCYDNIEKPGTGNVEKHPPCTECRGAGCGVCDGTGMRFTPGFSEEALSEAVRKAADAEGDFGVVWVGYEETLPDPMVADVVDELAGERGEGCRIRFANPTDIYERMKPRLEGALAARGDEPTVDLNPAMPGCYVSRIRNKQLVRAISYKLVAAEAALANQSWRRGEPSPEPEELAHGWRLVALNQFHDAITGTHIDSANSELMDMLAEAESAAHRFLPAPTVLIGPAYEAVQGDEQTKKLGEFDLKFDRTGILSLTSGGKDVFGELPCGRLRRPFRIAELALEDDFGDAWGTRMPPFCGPRDAISRVQLGDYNEFVETAPHGIRWSGTYRGGDPRVKKLAWAVTVSPSADGRRLDFKTRVDWDTHSKRLRVIVPVASQEDSATWEVPFGFIDRRFEPEKLDYSHWHANSMDFPALHWVRRSVDADSGVALLNKGLPCHRWMPGSDDASGSLDVSLLRSPEAAFCSVEPRHYEFWDIDGHRDTGRHEFDYSLMPYYAGLGAGDLTRIGYEYNLPAPVAPPFGVEGNVVVTAWKPAEDGSGWVLRVQEAGGEGTAVALAFEEERTVTETDLLERPKAEPVQKTKRFAAKLHKHGIMTLHVR